MSFRLKLLLTMVLLVVGFTATTLLIMENQVRLSYERHFQQVFRFQVGSFLQQRESRLQPVKERVAAAAASTRLFAAMEIAGQERPEPRDIDDLYQNAYDQLSDLFSSPASARGFCVFVNANGEVLYPTGEAKLAFSLRRTQRMARQIQMIASALGTATNLQVGYLAPESEVATAGVREVVFAPIVDRVAQKKMGLLGVGFPLPPSVDTNTLSSAIWLDGKLYSSTVGSNDLANVENAVEAHLQAGSPSQFDFPLQVQGPPHQVYCQAIQSGGGFPPAYQVCLYSLADAASEKAKLRRKIVFSGTVASLCALLLSWVISRSLTVPIQELVAGTTEIEQGNYTAKVKARGHDEVGKLGRAFNSMAGRIRETYDALEQKIAERTHELNERKRAEAALRKSEASLREAQRIARLGNWDWDVVSNELRWSDEIYSIFGLAPQGFGATYESFLERVHPGDREKVEQAVRQSLETGKDYTLDHRVLRPDGDHRIVRENAEVIRDAQGKAIRMVGTVQDVTEQKRIEAEFLRAQRMDGIGAIAGGMAHDLNNALAPILMGVQLIRNKVSDPQIQQMLSVMETNTHRGADMVRQVLTFARGRDGERELLTLARLIREMENILRQTMPKSIGVQAMVPSDLWPVMGNATQLHQALLNLCVNARDAMPKGGQLTVAADNVGLTEQDCAEMPESRPGEYVMLLVSDTGTGIPPEVLPKIFDAFFTTKDPGKGTGLGLSTIVRIVRNHGGFVSVKTKVGAGTTFEIYLPRAEPAAADRKKPTVEVAPQKRGRGELVLFVDDDRSVREMVAPVLAEQGYRVLTAANGAEALGLLAHHEPDLRLVLADVAMPVMDGLEMSQILHTRCPGVPIVLMSGTYQPGSAQLPTQAAVFLTKPFGLEQLLTLVAEVLQKNAAAPAQPAAK